MIYNMSEKFENDCINMFKALYGNLLLQSDIINKLCVFELWSGYLFTCEK